MKIADANIQNAPTRIDAVFPIFFITKSTGNCNAMHTNCDNDVIDTICDAEKFFTMVKNRVSTAI